MAKKQSKFDENGRSREADMNGRYTYRWHGLPDDHYAETMWKKFGYKPKSKEDFACWVQSYDNSYDYKIYSREQVVEISGKDAAARREQFNSFDTLTVREVYTRMYSILRKARRENTVIDEAFRYLCETKRRELLDKVILSYRMSQKENLNNVFTGWKGWKRYQIFRNKSADRIRNMYGGFWNPKAQKAAQEFQERLKSQWQ